MRTKLVLLMLLVVFAALAFLVSSAAAKPGAPHSRILTTPFDPPALVVKTAAMLPGSTYPWVHPVWTTVNGVTVVTLPHTIETANTQPPAWVLSH